MWATMVDGQLPPCERMTGLGQEQVVWLYEQLDAMLDWDVPAGRPHALPLSVALVAVLFGLRQNLAGDVNGEIFGCSDSTLERYQEELEPLIDLVLSPLYEEVRAQARREAVLVDGFVAPVGERDGRGDLHSGKKHVTGQNVQVVGTLGGRLADVGDPCPGSMHDSLAFVESGIAKRWEDHVNRDVPQMTGDKGYQGTGINTPYKKPRGRELTEVRKSCNTDINRVRAAVERVIAHLKCWKILKTGFRRSLHEFPAVLLTVARLETFRVYGNC